MRNDADQPISRSRDADANERDAPQPTPQFRRRSWLEFQRALDPLAPPKPIPTRRQH